MIHSNKPIKDTTVLVAMSGGVDSSVVAALLKDLGYNVIGVTLQLYNNNQVGKGKTCCGIKDIHDARMVAAKLGIQHYVMDYESVFHEEVMTKFADDYLSGLTPIPCIECNKTVKFRDLLKVAKQIDADAMATGHYIRRINDDRGIARMYQGIDPVKDQSYFLFATTQEQLEFLHFPLGDKTKAEVRLMAQKYQLPVDTKPDSQDICFVPNGDYVSVIKKLRPQSVLPGPIVLQKNNQTVGQHEGLVYYTIGQRRGLGVNWKKPLYVTKMDHATNTVYVGEEDELYQRTFEISRLNILDLEAIQFNQNLEVKIRSAQHQSPASISLDLENDRAVVTFGDPVGCRAITRGQACVIYKEDQVLGGGMVSAIATK